MSHRPKASRHYRLATQKEASGRLERWEFSSIKKVKKREEAFKIIHQRTDSLRCVKLRGREKGPGHRLLGWAQAILSRVSARAYAARLGEKEKSWEQSGNDIGVLREREWKTKHRNHSCGLMSSKGCSGMDSRKREDLGERHGRRVNVLKVKPMMSDWGSVGASQRCRLDVEVKGKETRTKVHRLGGQAGS